MRKKSVIIEWIRNKQNKKWSKKKIEYIGWQNKRYLRKGRCTFKTKYHLVKIL